MVRPRAASFISLTLVALSAVYSVDAWAQSQAAPAVSTEFWLSAGLTLALALVTGYTRGVDTRVSRVETDAKERFEALRMEQNQQQAQIDLIRDDARRDFPSRVETDQHRKFVEQMLAQVQESHRAMQEAHQASMARLERRLDQLFGGPTR